MGELTGGKMTMGLWLAACLLAVWLPGPAEAGQGCPFDDGSCQEYCQQQGCNMGYCGHFAWIQCICRKCGDEWSYYDKVHYNSDKTVNQTELDSLKLNRTSPLILVRSNATTGGSLKSLLSSTLQQQQKAENKTKSTLTTLLIPDLSDPSKIDLNDIPDEDSDKFLDFLAKHHERLVQAASAESQLNAAKGNGDDDDPEESETETEQTSTTSTISPLQISDSDSSSEGEETVEIRIRSSNNNLRIERDQKDLTNVPQRSIE